MKMSLIRGEKDSSETCAGEYLGIRFFVRYVSYIPTSFHRNR